LARACRLSPEEDAEAALGHLQGDLELCQRFGDAADVAGAHDALARAWTDAGSFAEALAHYDEAIRWLRIAVNRPQEVVCLLNRAGCRLLEADRLTDPDRQQQSTGEAWADYRRAKRVLDRLPYDAPTADLYGEAWLGLAQVFHRVGQPEQAEASAEQSIRSFDQSGNGVRRQAAARYLAWLRGP
jgi:tetratricopeptide (TPR) repeat protein